MMKSDGAALVRQRVAELAEPELAHFSAGLLPTAEEKRVLGVRVPKLRSLAKELAGSGAAEAFLLDLPHFYVEENHLHGLLLEREKNLDRCLERVETFLPFVDNWATCDIFCPAVFRKNAQALFPTFLRWTFDAREYTCRYGMGMLMRFFLDGERAGEAMQAVASVRREEYYVKMMQAWFFATALAKQYENALSYLTDRKLSAWVHNKTIQKARESFRVPPEHKAFLQTLRLDKTP